jgi:hypothetical protein
LSGGGGATACGCCGGEEQWRSVVAVERNGGARWLQLRGTTALGVCGGEERQCAGAVEEERCGARVLLWRRTGGVRATMEEQFDGGGLGQAMVREEEEEKKRNRRWICEKELRSAFQGLTGRAPRLTGRAAESFGQSPVSSFTDRTCPVRGD